MSTQNATPATESKGGVLLMTIAILIAVSGVFAFALLAEQPTGIRVGILIGSLVVGVVLGGSAHRAKNLPSTARPPTKN